MIEPNYDTRPLPKGWRWVKLGELATYVNGRAFKPSDWDKAGLPIIRIENLTNPAASYNYYTGNVEDHNLINNGDLLLSWSASLNAFIWDKDKAVLNQHIFKVYENAELITRQFLYWLLRAKMEEIKTQLHGATMKHITKPKFESMLAAIPVSINTQRKLAAELDETVSVAENMRAAAEQQRVALLILQLRTINDELKKYASALGQLSNVLSLMPRNGWSLPTESRGRTPVLTLSSVTGFKYDGTKVKWTNASVDENAYYWAQKDDLLISRSNTSELVGHAAICDGTPEHVIYPDLIMRTRVDPSKGNIRFVHYWLMGSIARSYIEEKAHGTSYTMKKITKDVVLDLPFPSNLSADEQSIIADYLDRQIASIIKISGASSRQLEAIDALPTAILREVFGEFVPPQNL